MHLRDNLTFDLDIDLVEGPLHYVNYELEVATSNGLAGDAFTRNARTDYGRTDTQTLLQMDYCWVLSVLEKVAKKT